MISHTCHVNDIAYYIAKEKKILIVIKLVLETCKKYHTKVKALCIS
jgi:predicted choloylglycine hydrolase